MTTVDVIVVARNEENTIGATLESIAEQHTEPGVFFRVLVVPNGCTDRTTDVARETIRQFELRPDMSFEILNGAEAGKSRALNYALEHTRAPLVFCVDSDVTFSADCFSRVGRAFDDPKIKLSGAEPQIIIGETLKDTLLGDLYRVRQLAKAVAGGSQVPIGRMMAFRRSVMNGWPLSFMGAEDTWLPFDVAHRYGWGVVSVAVGAEVYAVPPQSWLDLVLQEARWKLNYMHLMTYFPELETVAAESPRRVTLQRSLAPEQRAQVLRRMRQEGIAQAVLDLHELMPQLLQEHAESMGSELVRDDGMWEAVGSTKVLA